MEAGKPFLVLHLIPHPFRFPGTFFVLNNISPTDLQDRCVLSSAMLDVALLKSIYGSPGVG